MFSSEYFDEYFNELMFLQFGIQVEKDNYGGEAVILFKEELDPELVTEEFLELIPDKVLVYSNGFDIEGIEWMVCVAADANTNHPLFLVCLKNGVRVFEKLLNKGENKK
ncbi:hypothetical protein FZC78_09510 [Rossellomorea vietnamensis]|uniref:Uncharacterized protein n=1 Tax=Rossellomorea vietnamensis TaxID=218284 RepID=A0A5D4NX35_9BACI|nr:hypothetical protein [Rossellomorea vietnamensis]TYS18054.1 hypothetical protein FZC78_09510 [Rossellomorea vietnamensis]